MKQIFQSFIIISFLLISFQLKSQKPQYQNKGEAKGSISGKIKELHTNLPVEYANVSLYRLPDSSLVTGTITDKTGKFTINGVKFGKYFLDVKFIGYKSVKTNEIAVSPKNMLCDAGTISLELTSEEIAAVDVTAKKEMMEFSLDKKIINVDQNLNSAGGSAIDVLQNVPSLEVDIDGNVSLRGSTSLTVLIDGKPSGMSGMNRQAILEQIPASTIERIEIITNPSAKYDPDGMSGIINVILKKKKEPGYSGIATVNYGFFDKYNGSLGFNFRKNRINLFANYDFRYNERKGWSRWNRQTFLGDTTGFLKQNSNSYNYDISHNVKLGFDYNLNDFNSLTFSVLYNINNSDHNDLSKSTESDSLKIPVDYYETNSGEDEARNAIDYIVNYKHEFAKKGKVLTSDLIFTQSDGNEDKLNSTQYFNVDSFPFLPINVPDLTKSVTKQNSKVSTFQLDYTDPLNATTKVETGLKSSFRKIDNDYIFSNYSYLEFPDWETDTLTSNRFVYEENINAVYGTFSNVYGNIEYQIGTRIEAVFTKSSQKTTNKDYDNNYFSFFPTVHISYKMINDNSVQLSYSRRINRPSYEMLNPFQDKSTPNMVHYGNPKLKPEYINSYELGYLKYWESTTLNTTIFYRQINDIIQRMSTLDTTGISYATSENMSKGTSYGLELVLSQDIAKWWKVDANFSYYKNKIEGTQDGNELTNSNYTWNTKLNSNMTLFRFCDFQLIANYRAPQVNIQGTSKAMYNVDVAFKKDVLKGNGTINVRMSDVFNTQAFRMHREADNYIIDMNRRRQSHVVYIGFTYKINGGIKQKNKKPSDDNRQDDMMLGE